MSTGDLKMEKFHTMVVVNDSASTSTVKELPTDYYVPVNTDEIARDDYIIQCWNEKFPSKKITDINRINDFISSSVGLQEWYATIMINYQRNVVMPDYLKDVLTLQEFDQVKIKIDNYNSSLVNKSKEINDAAREMKTKLENINKKYSQIERDYKKDKILYILTLNRSDLPLDIQEDIINYTPSDIKDPHTRKIYAKEKLIQFQKSLIVAYKEKNIDPIKYVSSNRAVFRESSQIM